ncbi:MAG TPA: CHASE3 domain-containing protein, partial [Roseomonas sp.]
MLLSHMKDAETGQRGYLLTGREEYLAPYDAVLDDIRETIDALARTAVLEPSLAAPMAELGRLVPGKLAELAQTIDLRRTGQAEAALAVVASNEGRAMMEAARTQVTAFRAASEAERGRLETAERTRLALAAGSALGLSLVAGAVLLRSARTSHRRRAASEARLGLAEAASAVGLWERDLRRPGSATFTQTLLGLYGIAPEEPAARSFGPAAWAAMLHPEDRSRAEATLQTATETGRPFEVEFRIHRADTGETRWILRRGRREDGPDGQPRLLVGADLDVTGRKAAEERQSTLARELDHRVKNTLATVQALAAQTLTSAGAEPARFTRDFTDRLRALARAHDLLTVGAWQGATIGSVVEWPLFRPDTGRSPEDLGLRLGMRLCRTIRHALKSSPAASGDAT